MSGLSRIASLLALAFLLTTALPRLAVAEGARQSIHVLAIDSDDADEQADALTNALRSQVRGSPGWTLLETTQSLSMLTAAFQCPQHPDAACLERIGDKLKADQFLWGVMAKAPGHQVGVEVHLWARGKPDHMTRETYSDNMKDANDDGLRKVALLIFGKLLGAASGTFVLHASAETGSVLIDGVAKGALDHGRATLTLPVGSHTLEVQAPGFAPAKKDITIEPGGTSQQEIILEAAGASVVEGPSKPLPIRAILGWSGVAAGAILVGVGVGFTVGYFSDENDLNTQRQSNYQTGSKTPVANPCSPAPLSPTPATMTGCSDVNGAHSDIAGEIASFAVGGALAVTGIVLLVTNHPASSDPADKPTASAGRTFLSSMRVVPAFAPGGGSMVVVGRF